MTIKAMSIRLPADKAAELEAFTRPAPARPIDRDIAARQADHDFQKRLKRRLEEDREVLERLAR
jgi:hypothetical protein